jgi:hypothetical protein
MTTFSTWNNSNGGLFTVTQDWSPTGLPNSGNSDAGIFALSKAYTVTINANETLDFLQVGSAGALDNPTLAITGGTFSMASTANPFSVIYNFGTINVGAATLLMGLSATNDSTEINGPGTVVLAGTGTTPGTIATMQINAPFMGLYGGARVGVSANGQILGSTTNAVNLQIDLGTIYGGGSVGNGASAPAGDGLSLTVAAQGVVNANAGHVMVLETGANAIENAGLIETTAAGGLTIDSQMFQNGRLVAAGTGALTINGVEVQGLGNVAASNVGRIVLHDGQLAIGGFVNIGSAAAPGGVLTTTSGDTLGVLASSGDNFAGADVLSADINNYGTISVANDSTLNLNSTLTGPTTGILAVNGSTGPTKLEIYGTGATVDGGSIVLSNSAQNSIVSDGAGTQLSNFSIIRGSGTIGDGWLRLYNSPTGRINANQAVGLTIVSDANAIAAGSESVNFNAGIIATTGAGGLTIDGAFSNAGILEALGTGALTINGENLATNPGVDGGGGTLEALAGGSIVLKNNAEVTQGGILSIAAGGTMRTTSGDTADIVENSLINSGTFSVAANSTAILEGTWQNSHAVTLNGSFAAGSAQVEIEAGKNWTLLDGGTVTLNGFSDSIVSQGAGAELRDRGNIVQGAGTIGDANMTIESDFGSTIDAMVEGSSKTLTLDAKAFDPTTHTTFISNAGIMEASVGATLDIDSAMFNSLDLIANAGSMVHAQDAVFGPGLSIIRGNGSIEFGAECDNDVRYAQGSGGQLILDDSAQFFGSIHQMTVGDSVDLRDFAFNSANPSAMKLVGGFGSLDGGLQITNGTSTSSSLFLQGDYQSAAWTFKSDGHLGTTVTLAAFHA